SGTETYDGTEHSVTGYDVTKISNSLYKASDFTFNGKAEVKGIDAGSYDMELKAEDFTNNNTNFAKVTFKIEDGTLTISKRQVTLTSVSDSKVYDGTPLTRPEVAITGDGFVKGEATAKATGSVTYVSESPVSNTIEIEKTEAYKDSNYQIEMSEGELSITPVTDKVTVTITENSGSAKYDGIEHSATGYVVKSISNPLYKETDFTFSGNAEVKGTDAGSYDMELKAEDFTNNNTNFANVTFEIEDGKLTISPRQVTLTSETASKAYDGTALTRPNVTVDGDGFVEGEATAKATGSALKAGESVTNTIEIVEGKGYKEGNYTITKLPGTLTVTASEKAIVITAASNSWMYDGSAHSDGSYTVTYDGAEIKANAEGKYILPTGDEVTAVVTGSVTNVEDTVAENNEITEYAVENAGNYNSIQTVNGTLAITPRPVTLTSETGSKVYDGTPLTKPEVTIGKEGFVEGEATAKATGSVTYVSESPVTNTIEIEKKEAYKDSNYQIEMSEGELSITPVTDEVTVTITEHNGSAKYDGIEHTVTGYDVSISNPLYKETDFMFSGNAEVKGTDAGSYNMELKAEDFTNKNTNFANVTFEIEDGTLTISKRQVTLTSASDSKAYDGTALTNQKVTVGGDGFAEGEGASYDVTGSQTYVGSSENTFTYTLNGSTVKRSRMLKAKAKAAAPETKASNYVITKEYGTLTVTDENVTGVVTKTHEGEKYNLNDTVTFKITVQNIYAEAQDITITEQPGVTITGENKFTDVQPGESVETTATYTITEEDILRGEFGNTATAIFSNRKEYTGTDEVIPADPNPHLTVEKTTTSSPANGKSYALGETITYKITVKNDGNLTIKDIEVTDELTGNTGNKAWKIEELAPGAEETFTASYTVTEKDILAGSVVNEATAKGTSPDPENPDVPVDPGKKEDPTDPAKTSLQVVKTTISEPANGETYALGETIEYRITVTNTGNLTVNDVKVLDELTGNIGDQALVVEEPLAPGKKAEFNVSYTVTEKDILAGSVVNEATATGTSTNPDDPEVPVIPGKTEDPTDPANGHLVITKSTISEPANGKAYALGETITYKIIVKNDGNLTIKDIEVTDELTGNTGDKAWKIEELAPGKLEEFTTSYTVTEKDILAGSVVNEATAKGKSPDPEKPDVPVKPGEKEDPTDPANGHLNITKTTTSTPANGSAYALGETITYQITVKNDGNLTIKDIEVTDELTGNTGDKAWKIDSLSPDESKVFTAEYKVTEADILKGEVHNEATAKGKSPDPEKPEVPVDPGTKDEPTVKAEPSLFVDKEANQKAGGYALGEEISYTIRVLNNGNVTISNITVTDEMTGLNETIPTLAVGEEKTFTTTHKVTEADILKGKILNVATAKGTDPKGNPVEKDDTKEIDTEPKNAHVTLEKETTSTPADGKAYVIGEKITYQITVTNDGNLTAANLVVTDELTGNSGENAWKIESLAPGESKVFTAEYTVTEADAQAGKVVNTAAASGTSPDPEKPELPTTPGTKEVPTQDNSGTIQITKNLTLDGESITAKDVTFYVALFEDEACTVRLTEAKGLTFNGTSAATVTFDHMLVGKTYYVSETDGNGNAVTNGSINGTSYMADFSEGRSVTVSETNGSASLTFTNVFMTLPSDRFYKDARLTLTKKVLDADGKAKKSNETFYIGLFADAAHTQLTDRTTENVIALDMNGASESAAKTINIVISADTPATFYIAEVDKNGNPVGKDFAYEATVDLPEVTLSETNSNVSVVITNQEKAEEPTETEEPTEKPTETEEPTAKTTEKPADKTTKAPKTGDNTNIWLYVTLMMLSALTGSGYAVRRRRKNRKAR
ncbi:MAG: MBG domain-containing protein, partial [Blautia sp.]|nr:MBG domain-containing protein [Blautia sp.]